MRDSREREKDVEGDRKRKRGSVLAWSLMGTSRSSAAFARPSSTLSRAAFSISLTHIGHFPFSPVSLSFEIINLAAKEG